MNDHFHGTIFIIFFFLGGGGIYMHLYAFILAEMSLGLCLSLSLSQVLILWLVFPLYCGGGWSVAEERALVYGRAPSAVGAAVLISAAHHQRWAVWSSTAVPQVTAVATMGHHRDLSAVRHSQPLLYLHLYYICTSFIGCIVEKDHTLEPHVPRTQILTTKPLLQQIYCFLISEIFVKA